MALDLHTTTDLFRLLGDSTRMRLLALLAEEELTVAELTRITRLTQSRVSTHLAKLRDAGLVLDRPDGSSSYHRLNEEGMSLESRRAWTVLLETTRDPLLEQDQDELRRVIGARGSVETWADTVAGQMDRHYSPGRTWEATAWGTLGLARLGDVLDVASGDGVLAELLAPRARSVTCLDLSEKVSDAGRRRLEHLTDVTFRQGDVHALPFENDSFDQALLMNALTYSPDPERVFAELARVLRPGGTLVAVTLNAHRHRTAVDRFNHVRLGFTQAELRRMLEENHFVVDLCEITSRERRRPHFEIITIHATRRGTPEPRRDDTHDQ